MSTTSKPAVPDVDISQTVSESSSQCGELVDVELTVSPVAGKTSKPRNRKKLGLLCLVVSLIVAAAVVATALLLSKGRGKTAISDLDEGPSMQESDQNDMDEQQGGKEPDEQENAEDESGNLDDQSEGEDKETDETSAVENEVREPGTAQWTTAENALPLDEDEDDEVFPLLSLGDFTGLGSVMTLQMEDSPAKIYFGNPDAGCVTVLKQVGGWSLPDMWVWNMTDLRGAPPMPEWEQIGESICRDEGFGAHIANAIDFVNWDSFDFPETDPEAWNDLASEYDNAGASFVVSNPNDGTASFYSYDLNEQAWALRQTINSPEGYTLNSLHAEGDFFTISYTTEMEEEDQIRVYQAAVDTENYDRIGEATSFMGLDSDVDSSGHVATLASDRSVRAYYSNGADSYDEIGKPFVPAFVMSDSTSLEEDLKVVKVDGIDAIVTAAIVDNGSEGMKTIGIGSYHYIDPNWSGDPCFATSYYPDRCDELVTNVWDPGYHGAAEFEPASTDIPTKVTMNARGTAVAVATKTGFKVFSPFNVPFPVEYDLEFDAEEYLTHEIAFISSWGLVSVLVEFKDGSSKIQSYIMAGV